MINLKLTRYNYGADKTQGVLNLEKIWLADTLELPWLEDEVNVSCIPEGTYHLTRTFKKDLGFCFEVLNVPGRTDILIHAANLVSQLKGCIAVGIKFGNTLEDSDVTLQKLLTFVSLAGTLEVVSIGEPV